MGKANVMVVEDEPYTRNCLQLILAEAGFSSLPASSGDEALAQLESSMAENIHVDALVTDITMPHMSGIELINELHRRKIDLPILAITAFPENYLKLKDIKIAACLEKPFDKDAFIKHLTRAMSQSPTHLTTLADNTSCQPRPSASPSASKISTTKRILLMEDDAKIRQQIAQLLAKDGYQVSAASNGQEAETLLKESQNSDNAFDLIIADVRRPLTVGMTMVKKLREHVIKLPGLIINAFPGETASDIENCSANELFDSKLFLQCVNRFFHNEGQSSAVTRQTVHIPWQFFQRQSKGVSQ